MPVLALEEVHEREPADVLGGFLVGAGAGTHVTDAVHEALGVKREDLVKDKKPKYDPTDPNAGAEV